MGFFEDFYKNVINPVAKTVGGGGAIAGRNLREFQDKQAAAQVSDIAKFKKDNDHPSFFDVMGSSLAFSAKQVPKFTGSIAKAGAELAPYFAPETSILRPAAGAGSLAQIGAKAVNNFVPGAVTSVGASVAEGNRNPTDIAKTAVEQGFFNALGSTLAPHAKVGAEQAAKAGVETYRANPTLSSQGGYIGGAKATGFPEAKAAGAVTKGIDAHPKFEVTDEAAKYTPEPLAKSSSANLADVLQHPYLYEDYPQLASWQVKLSDNLGSKENGFTDRNKNTIILNAKKPQAKQFETLMHETQHAIQTVEGHAAGGSPGAATKYASANVTPYEAYKNLAGETEARNVAGRQSMTQAQREAIPFNTTSDVAPENQIVHYDNGQPGFFQSLNSQEPTTTAVDRLMGALKEAGPGVKQVEKAQSEALSKRVAAGSNILAKTPGETGFAKAKVALQGPLVSEKPTPITTKLEQGDLNELYGNIQAHPTLRFFEKVRAFDALNKIFKGEVPQRNELGLLEEVFGPEFSKTVLDNRSKGEKLRQLVGEVANVPRAILSSVDFSAPFRQGLVLTVKSPVKGLAAGKEMFRQAFSEKNHAQWLNDVKDSPEYGRMKDAGLYIADPKAIAGGLTSKEEAFMTSLAEKIPLIGRVVKSGERAYVGYLNKIRVDTFNDLANKFEASGQGGETNLKGLAKFVNVATGRGNLGAFEKIAPELNTVFFAPRNMAARINMLNPVWYKNLPAPARKEAIKGALAVVGTGLTILSLAKLAGAEVEADPRSTDFGKIKVGNQRYDIWGGFQQYARFIAQLATGQKKTGNTVSKASRLDTAVNFGRSKLAPVPATLVDIGEGTDYVGKPVTPASVAQKNLVPFVLQDIQNSYQQGGLESVPQTAPAIFGVGVQNYAPKVSTKARGGASKGTGLKKSKNVRRTRSLKTPRIRKGRTVKVAKTRLRSIKTRRVAVKKYTKKIRATA